MTEFNENWEFLFVFFAVITVVYVFFLLEQQKTLLAVEPENRTIPVSQIWLQLIPLFGLAWQFVILKGIADSLRNEFEARHKISTLGIWEEGITDEVNIHPTYATGKGYCILVCITAIPFVGFITCIFTLILWITYWGQLVKYRKILTS